MAQSEIIDTLRNKLGFSDKAIKKLIVFHDYLLRWNNKYNLISKNTENQVWSRHILDSAQLVSYLEDPQIH